MKISSEALRLLLEKALEKGATIKSDDKKPIYLNSDSFSLKADLITEYFNKVLISKSYKFNVTYLRKIYYSVFPRIKTPAVTVNIKLLNVLSAFIGFESIDDWLLKNNYNISPSDNIDDTQPEHKTTLKPLLTVQGDLLPDYVVGIYEGFFVRPQSTSLSILYVQIKKDGTAVGKSTKATYSGRIIFQKGLASITILFEVPNIRGKVGYHIFQFSLTLPVFEKFTLSKFLCGVYSGSDPVTEEFVSGRMLLHKISSNESNLQLRQLFLKSDPIDLNVNVPKHYSDISNRIGDNPFLLHFFLDKNFVDDVNFLRPFSNHIQFKDLQIVGSFSIYSTDSNEQYVNRGVMKIDNLGRVLIKGRRQRLYTGWARILNTEGILSINIEKVVYGYDKSEDDYFFHYLIKVFPKLPSGEVIEYFHGIRTIINPKDKPFAGRVILLPEANVDFFERKEYIQIPLFLPQERKKIIDELLEENKGREELCLKIITYLIGDENNLIISSGEPNHPLERKINYGFLFFSSACKYASLANSSTDNDKKRNYLNISKDFLTRAWYHNFGKLISSDYLKDQLKTKTEEFNLLKNEINKGDLILLKESIHFLKDDYYIT